MRKAIIITVLALICAGAWAQAYASDNDGRNWNSWSYDMKSCVVFGIMIGEYAIMDLIETAYKYGDGDISLTFITAAEELRSDNMSVKDIRERLDIYYAEYANQIVPLWKAYFLCRGIMIWTGE